MNTRVKSGAQLVIGFLLLGLIGWGAYLAVSALVSILASMQSNVAVAVVAASGTIVVSVISLAVSKYLEGKVAVRQELRAKKVPIYESIIGTLFKTHFADKVGEKPPTEKELMRFFITVTEQLVVWGSDEVVREFRAFRMAFVDGGNPTEGLFQYEKLLNAIRKDLGHKNQGFKRGTLLGLWVNDIDRHVG